jgi:hypothetical protein
MLLRDHPLMSFKGMSSWPPVWTWIDGHEKKSARGEIGILKEVTLSKITAAGSMQSSSCRDRSHRSVPYALGASARLLINPFLGIGRFLTVDSWLKS